MRKRRREHNWLCTLPADLVHHISFFLNVKDMTKLSMTSKRHMQSVHKEVNVAAQIFDRLVEDKPMASTTQLAMKQLTKQDIDITRQYMRRATVFSKLELLDCDHQAIVELLHCNELANVTNLVLSRTKWGTTQNISMSRTSRHLDSIVMNNTNIVVIILMTLFTIMQCETDSLEISNTNDLLITDVNNPLDLFVHIPIALKRLSFVGSNLSFIHIQNFVHCQQKNRFGNLIDIDFSQNPLTQEGVSLLYNAYSAASSTRLRRLWMENTASHSNNDVEDAMNNMFATQTGLTDLNLASNNIDDEFAAAIDLKRLSQLEILDVSYNKITDQGLKSLSQSLCWEKLTHLNMQANRLKNVRLSRFTNGTPYVSLVHLNVSRNQLTDIGVRNIFKYAVRQKRVTCNASSPTSIASAIPIICGLQSSTCRS